MRVTHAAPSPPLAPLVRTYEWVEADEAAERTLVPEAGLVLGFRCAGASWLVERDGLREVPRCAATGVRLTARRMRTAAGSAVLLAKLQPGAGAAFLDAPPRRLQGRTAPLAEVVPSGEVAAAAAQIAAAPGVAGKVAALEAFLRGRLARRPFAADPAVAAALRALEADPGAVRVGALARAAGLSLDALEKRFRAAIGASPKQLAAVLRLRRALALQPRAPSLSVLALEAGFYDQAHFGRRFAAQLGAAPGRFLAARDHCME